MSNKRRIYCKFCDAFFYDMDDLVSHLEAEHPEMIPEDMVPWQFAYFIKTGKSKGSCIMCHHETEWNDETHKYARFCNNPKCKEKYREEFSKRMIGKYGKVTLLDDPEQQRKMLANRAISGEYQFHSNPKYKFTFTGSYEKSFLEFLDDNGFDPADLMAPSPHNYEYTYEGKKHFYFPDFFIPSLNLEIEIKDGTQTHPKIVAVDKVKEKLKDDVMRSNQSSFNYLKIVEKDNEKLFKFIEASKEHFANGDNSKIVML